jgi:hypothetical protein
MSSRARPRTAGLRRDITEDAMQTLAAVDLSGVCMTCTLPEVFKDNSLVKPVPDHQEMWFWGEHGYFGHFGIVPRTGGS